MSRRTRTRSEAGRGARLPADAGDAVRVTVTEGDARDASTLAAALPDPSSLPPGTRVIVAADAASSRSFAGRLFATLARTQGIPRVVRCTALLLRGYDEVGGGLDPETSADLAWGRRAPALD